MNDRIPYVIVVDVGGTSTRLGILSPSGELLDDINQFPTPGAFLLPQESLSVLQQMLVDRLIGEICALRQRHPQLNLSFVGVSFGAVITHQGIVENASILWHQPARGFDIAEELRSRLPNTEIWVVNDVSAMAWRYQQHSRFVLFTVSTGVASKVFNQALNTKEKLELDDGGLGGEIGHVVVAPERVQAALKYARDRAKDEPARYQNSMVAQLAGESITATDLGTAALRGDSFALEVLEAVNVPFCECGNLADLCAYTSGPAVTRMAQRVSRYETERFQKSRLAELCAEQPEAIDTRAIALAAQDGDPLTWEILDQSTFYLGLSILQICASLGLDRVFISGGFANGVGTPYFQSLHRNLSQLMHPSGFFTGWTQEQLKALIQPCPDYYHDALIGVGLMVQSHLRRNRVVVKPIGESRCEMQWREPPRCSKVGAIARIRYAGVCSTDLQIYRGDRLLEPGILGHECVAQIIEVGDKLQGLSVEDWIAINPNNPVDEYNKVGHNREGIFQDLFSFDRDLVDKQQIVKLPQTVHPEWVLMELLACILHAQNYLSRPYSNCNLLILGAGISGLLHTKVAQHRAAKRILLANRSQPKLDFAVKAGFVPAEDALLLGDRIVDEVFSRTNRRGADIVIVALAGDGGVSGIEQILPCLADGATICLFGGFTGNTLLELNGSLVDCQQIRSRRLSVSIRTRDNRQLTFVGSRGSEHEDYTLARDLVTSGQIDLSQLVTQIISFPALPRVLSEMSDRGTVEGKFAMRVVVDMALFGDVIHHLTI
ncbi:ROK family protein [Scytonema sp. PRP1]|uniref:ROK family protein n=1 Tax=Scytonema sp. PRP1 TaxID=3120513 RepID=UPI002FCEB618